MDVFSVNPSWGPRRTLLKTSINSSQNSKKTCFIKIFLVQRRTEQNAPTWLLTKPWDFLSEGQSSHSCNGRICRHPRCPCIGNLRHRHRLGCPQGCKGKDGTVGSPGSLEHKTGLINTAISLFAFYIILKKMAQI